MLAEGLDLFSVIQAHGLASIPHMHFAKGHVVRCGRLISRIPEAPAIESEFGR